LFLKIKIVVFLLLMVNFACATLVDVSKTSILVKDTNANDPLLLKQAFAQVISNNTGEPIANILQNPHFFESNIKAGIKRSYFEKINNKYLTNKDISYYWFHVVMHENFIDNLIKQAGFSLLPHNRQEIVLWAVKEEILPEEVPKDLAIDEIPIQPFIQQSMIQEPLLQYGYNDSVFNYWFKHWAESMGMVFVIPEMDEVDMLIVTPDSIQNLSFQAHEQTKLKYAKKLSLLLYLKRTEQDVKYRTGTFIEDSEMSIKHFQQAGIEEGELIYSVVADMAEKYANAYKVSAYDLESNSIQIVINGITGFDDVNKIKKYIKDVSVIETSQIVSASKGQMVISANLSVSTDSFLQIVKRQNVLYHNLNGSINQLVFYLITDFE